MDIILYCILPLFIGWILDRVLGDPIWLPHPVVFFGKIISYGEKRLNKGKRQFINGAVFSILLILSVFFIAYFINKWLSDINVWLSVFFNSILVFYCLAGKTLVDEVRNVFVAVDKSVEDGRMQVARIVGRDTSELSPQQIRTAALETLSENLSDGVIAPLFWYLLLGVPGMLAYKIINTLDSMIGYKNERYKKFGCVAARLDDIVNYIPARITAMLMIIVAGKLSLFTFIRQFGHKHASPNSGYPEAALAGILNCRFGGSNSYFGKLVEKPFIGENEREFTLSDMQTAIKINQRVEVLMVLIMLLIYLTIALCQK